MIKAETRKALSEMIEVIDCWRDMRARLGKEEDMTWDFYFMAENFVKAFRKNELKIDD